MHPASVGANGATYGGTQRTYVEHLGELEQFYVLVRQRQTRHNSGAFYLAQVRSSASRCFPTSTPLRARSTGRQRPFPDPHRLARETLPILADTTSFIKPAQIAILLVPIHPIKRAKFDRYAELIRGFSKIPLSDVPPDSRGDRGESTRPLAGHLLRVCAPSGIRG